MKDFHILNKESTSRNAFVQDYQKKHAATCSACGWVPNHFKSLTVSLPNISYDKHKEHLHELPHWQTPLQGGNSAEAWWKLRSETASSRQRLPSALLQVSGLWLVLPWCSSCCGGGYHNCSCPCALWPSHLQELLRRSGPVRLMLVLIRIQRLDPPRSIGLDAHPNLVCISTCVGISEQRT